MRPWIVFMLLAGTGCLLGADRQIAVDCLAQRVDLVDSSALEARGRVHARCVDLVDALGSAHEPLSPLVADAITDHIEGLAEDGDVYLGAIDDATMGMKLWVGAMKRDFGEPSMRVPAPSPVEDAMRSTYEMKIRLLNHAKSILGAKFGIPSLQGKAAAPSSGGGSLFEILAAGLVPAAAGAAAFLRQRAKTNAVSAERARYKDGASALAKAIDRMRKNGDDKQVVAAVAGEGVPDAEKQAGRAVYQELKAEGQVG